MLNNQSGGKELQEGPAAEVLFNHFKALSTDINNTKNDLGTLPYMSSRNPGMQMVLMMIFHQRKSNLQ